MIKSVKEFAVHVINRQETRSAVSVMPRWDGPGRSATSEFIRTATIVNKFLLLILVYKISKMA